MFKVLIECPNCGQHQFYVRSSEKMTRLTRSSSCICRNCNAKLTVQTEVVKVELPNYVDTPEALRANKPYKRADLVARITYTERKSETGEALYTMYQEPSLKVSGIINIKNGVQINTRPKEWSIQLKPKNWEEQQLQKKLENATETERAEAKRKYYEKLGFNEEAIALLGELAPPWTCVSNCTGLKNNQISEEARSCLRNELITMRGRVTEHQIDDLLNGKRLKIWANSQKTMFVSYSRGRLIEHIVDNYESFLN